MKQFDDIYMLHLVAGFFCGEENTCGDKVDYKSQETATKSADLMSIKFDKIMEAYPCTFCRGWHIGRMIPLLELRDIVRKHMEKEL